MNKKKQEHAMSLISVIQNSFEDPIFASSVPFYVRKSIDELYEIIKTEFSITVLVDEPVRSTNFLLVEDNLKDRIKEVEDCFNLMLNASTRGTKHGVRVQINYGYSEE